ncbi:hypothetical protein EGW08_017616 [Elysia chlorotica]|uniref:Uncharacterized protein n=1 Tax=Elysia chlorotica TaxID=188477 RepID=A0A433SZB5_ELYCH|nr:hypothetical protein EGW08_017616 [Elysia chlorotica]
MEIKTINISKASRESHPHRLMLTLTDLSLLLLLMLVLVVPGTVSDDLPDLSDLPVFNALKNAGLTGHTRYNPARLGLSRNHMGLMGPRKEIDNDDKDDDGLIISTNVRASSSVGGLGGTPGLIGGASLLSTGPGTLSASLGGTYDFLGNGGGLNLGPAVYSVLRGSGGGDNYDGRGRDDDDNNDHGSGDAGGVGGGVVFVVVVVVAGGGDNGGGGVGVEGFGDNDVGGGRGDDDNNDYGFRDGGGDRGDDNHDVGSGGGGDAGGAGVGGGSSCGDNGGNGAGVDGFWDNDDSDGRGDDDDSNDYGFGDGGGGCGDADHDGGSGGGGDDNNDGGGGVDEDAGGAGVDGCGGGGGGDGVGEDDDDGGDGCGGYDGGDDDDDDNDSFDLDDLNLGFRRRGGFFRNGFRTPGSSMFFNRRSGFQTRLGGFNPAPLGPKLTYVVSKISKVSPRTRPTGFFGPGNRRNRPRFKPFGRRHRNFWWKGRYPGHFGRKCHKWRKGFPFFG